MRKFLLPIINIVNVILASITYGLLSKPTAEVKNLNLKSIQDFYEIVWVSEKVNAIGIVAFFLFIVATALTLVAFLPVKARKFVALGAGSFYIAAGVLALLTPFQYNPSVIPNECIELSGALIASAVLMFVTGAFNLMMAALDFTAKEAK